MRQIAILTVATCFAGAFLLQCSDSVVRKQPHLIVLPRDSRPLSDSLRAEMERVSSEDRPVRQPSRAEDSSPAASAMRSTTTPVIQPAPAVDGYLSEEAARAIIIANNFYDNRFNVNGSGITNDLELSDGGEIIIDYATRLIWQQGGSSKFLLGSGAQAYIDSLNRVSFNGFADWRLPSLAEAMSLMTMAPNPSGNFISPLFDQKQKWIWTAEKKSQGEGWIVYYSLGNSYYDRLNYAGSYCRAVRK